MTIRARWLGRRSFLLGASAVATTRIAMARHRVGHRKCVAPTFFVNLQDVLKKVVPLDLELEIDVSDSEQQTLMKLQAAPPNEYDFFFSYGTVATQLPAGVVSALVVDRLKRWPEILEQLSAAPTIRDAWGQVIGIPIDWGYYALAHKSGANVELLSYDRLRDPSLAPKLALWSSVGGALSFAMASGIGDPYGMPVGDIDQVRQPMSEAKQNGATLVRDVSAIRDGWQSGMFETALIPNVWLPDFVTKEGRITPPPSSPHIVWIDLVSIVKGVGEGDDTYEIFDGLLSEEVGVRLLVEGQGPVVRGVFKSEVSEVAMLRNHLGLDAPENVLSKPVWDRSIPSELEEAFQGVLKSLE